MDINQTPLQQLKTNKTGISRSVSENRAMAEAARSKDASLGTSQQNLKQTDFKEGQLVKGQILDHRYNEVKIQLEPGKQIISARLSGDIPLSIGQEAHFQVTEGSPDQLVLKYVPDSAAPADTTIQKALTESGLPMTERNKAIVSELLDQRMPVDKQTLQNLIRLSVTNREASPLTLVLMYKNQIPMTQANIRQFEAYQAGTHQLLTDIKTISRYITDILRLSETPDMEGYSQQQKVPELKLNESLKSGPRQTGPNGPEQAYDNPVKNAIMMNGKLIAVLNGTNGNSNFSLTEIPINQLLTKDELAQLGEAIEAKSLSNPISSLRISQDPSGQAGTFSGILPGISEQTSLLPGNPGQTDLASGLIGNVNSTSELNGQSNLLPELIGQIDKGNLSLEETINLLAKLYTDSSDSPRPDNLQDILNQIMVKVQTDPETNPIISKLLNQYSYLKETGTLTLSDILGQSERTALSGLLTNSSGTEDGKDRILQGSLSLKETLAFIQENLTRMDKADAYQLLQSPEYSKLLEEAFLEKWTVSPEKIAKKFPVSDLYNQLNEDLEKLNTLMKTSNEAAESLRYQEPVKNLQDNLQFMRDLNDVFTYLQLPARLRDREAHADLYVFTRKKALGDKRENLSVLLHLDMENLGALNVHIQMNPGNRIQADFYLEDTEAGRLIKENLPSFTAGLQKKGYIIQAEVKASYKKPDFSRDFIEQSLPDQDIRRYTFDIRT